jgi:LEA14-like dessication related protein
MSFKIDAMKDVVARLDREKRDSADYAVNAQFDLDVPVAGQRNFDINFNKRMLAVRPVKIKPGKVDIDNFGLKDTEVNMEMTVSNPNPFSISLKDAAFTMKIENDLEVEGRIPETVRIPVKGSENISMVSEVKTSKMPKLGWKLLFRKPETNYNVLFKTRLVSENEMLNGSKMNVTMTGTLQDLKEVASKKK